MGLGAPCGRGGRDSGGRQPPCGGDGPSQASKLLLQERSLASYRPANCHMYKENAEFLVKFSTVEKTNFWVD